MIDKIKNIFNKNDQKVTEESKKQEESKKPEESKKQDFFDMKKEIPSFGSMFGVFKKFKFINIIKSCYIYNSKEPAEKIVLKHDLDTMDIEVQLWIKEEDGTYYNDLTPVKIIDKDNIEIDFAEKSNFKVIIRKCEYGEILKKVKKLGIDLKIFENFRLSILKK